MLAQAKNKSITIYNTDNWKNRIPLGMPRSVEKNGKIHLHSVRNASFILPMLTGSTYRNKRHKVEPRTNAGK